MGIKRGQYINMKKGPDGSYQKGVELGKNGKVLKPAQGGFLKALNMLAMTSAVAIITATAGFKFGYLWKESPILIALGNVTAFVFLLISQLATFVWYLLTGMNEPMYAVGNALPVGSVVLQTSVCFYPITLTMLVIGLRTYSRIYVSTLKACALFIALISITFLSVLILAGS